MANRVLISIKHKTLDLLLEAKKEVIIKNPSLENMHISYDKTVYEALKLYLKI